MIEAPLRRLAAELEVWGGDDNDAGYYVKEGLKAAQRVKKPDVSVLVQAQNAALRTRFALDGVELGEQPQHAPGVRAALVAVEEALEYYQAACLLLAGK